MPDIRPSDGSPSTSKMRLETVYDADEIAARISELSGEIAARNLDNLLVISILKGSFIFAADLIRALHHSGLAPEVDFITLSSYRDATRSSGTIDIVRDTETELEGRNVLLVDDILESGRTLAFAKDLMAARGAHQVITCVLLDKPVSRAADIKADFCAFQCPDVFVVGYGMDLAHRYRQLPFVGQLIENPDV